MKPFALRSDGCPACEDQPVPDRRRKPTLGFLDIRDLCAMVWIRRCGYDHGTYSIDALSYPAIRLLHRYGVSVYYSSAEGRVKLYLDARYGD